jgi:NTP pyrophosphatase (non-canonical NTP hydrolase)
MIEVLNIDDDTLELALKCSDENFQLDMFQEECGEAIVELGKAIVAVNHFRRNRLAKEKLAEEIADVFIMCQKLAKIVGTHLVDQQVLTKMERLRNRIAARLREASKDDVAT